MNQKPSYIELERQIELLNRELLKKDSDLREIQELVNLGNWEWNIKEQTLIWSEEVYCIFGLDPESFTPSVESFEATIHPDDREDFLKQREIMLKEKKRACIDHRIVLPDGSIRHVQERTKLLFNHRDELYRVIGTVQDITERKQMEEALREWEWQRQQLQKAESLGRMAGAIAHHFNNQFSVILGNLELALDHLYGNPKVQEFLQDAGQATYRSAEISELMLTYLGHTTDRIESLDLSEVCRHHLPCIQNTVKKGVTVETSFLSPGPIVAANKDRVRYVLTHFITNSSEAIGDGQGKITLSTKIIPRSDIPKIHIMPIDWEPVADLFACLEVKDDGCGISGQDMNRLFDPFFTTKFIGRGLGLTVNLGIVKGWNGAISFENNQRHGTTFRVFLPLLENELPWRVDKEFMYHDPEDKGLILLVEDQDPVRRMAERMLRYLGFSVLSAVSGTEAIDLFRHYQDVVRCVITDLTMPDMDGWETLAALRKLRKDLPVVLASGFTEPQAMSMYHTETPQAFLHKPYSKEGLLNALHIALESAV